MSSVVGWLGNAWRGWSRQTRFLIPAVVAVSLVIVAAVQFGLVDPSNLGLAAASSTARVPVVLGYAVGPAPWSAAPTDTVRVLADSDHNIAHPPFMDDITHDRVACFAVDPRPESVAVFEHSDPASDPREWPIAYVRGLADNAYLDDLCGPQASVVLRWLYPRVGPASGDYTIVFLGAVVPGGLAHDIVPQAPQLARQTAAVARAETQVPGAAAGTVTTIPNAAPLTLGVGTISRETLAFVDLFASYQSRDGLRAFDVRGHSVGTGAISTVTSGARALYCIHFQHSASASGSAVIVGDKVGMTRRPTVITGAADVSAAGCAGADAAVRYEFADDPVARAWMSTAGNSFVSQTMLVVFFR